MTQTTDVEPLTRKGINYNDPDGFEETRKQQEDELIVEENK